MPMVECMIGTWIASSAYRKLRWIRTVWYAFKRDGFFLHLNQRIVRYTCGTPTQGVYFSLLLMIFGNEWNRNRSNLQSNPMQMCTHIAAGVWIYTTQRKTVRHTHRYIALSIKYVHNVAMACPNVADPTTPSHKNAPRNAWIFYAWN